MERYSASEQDTEALGRALVQRLQPGAVVAFTGDLGAGKTAFARGLAAGSMTTGLTAALPGLRGPPTGWRGWPAGSSLPPSPTSGGLPAFR